MPERHLLARGAIFEIRAEDEWVTCEVVNRNDVSAEEGARCATEMNEVLSTRVLGPRSLYRGLVFDVRKGPPAFGPKTRAALEMLFAAATTYGRRIAVVVGESPTQRMQFANLCLEHAKEHAQVFQSEASAREWLKNFKSEPPRR
jgi:hypothetical protein